jgi:hypothetical protein
VVVEEKKEALIEDNWEGGGAVVESQEMNAICYFQADAAKKHIRRGLRWTTSSDQADRLVEVSPEFVQTRSRGVSPEPVRAASKSS